MKKGYLLITLFAAFVAIAGTLKFRLYVKRDFDTSPLDDILFRIVISFLIYLIPGLLLVRWYYKMKEK